MMIALYFLFVNVVVPRMGTYAQVLLEPVMVIFITLAGIYNHYNFIRRYYYLGGLYYDELD